MIRTLAWVILFVWLGAVIGLAAPAETNAGSNLVLELKNGSSLSGDFVNGTAQGVVLRRKEGGFTDREPWTNFTQIALKELAKISQAKRFVEPLLEEEEVPEPEPSARQAAPEIRVKIPERLERPDPKAGIGSLFRSPLSIVLLLLVYAANIYAAFEVAVFRNHPRVLTCAVAALLPILGPIAFLCLPTRTASHADEPHTDPAHGHPPAPHGPHGAAPAPAHGPGVPAQKQPTGPVAPGAHAPAAGAVPPPQIFPRGQFTFNRRFFETRLAGFMRMVPSDAERDMVIHVKSSRGDHVGPRIARVSPNELGLQVTKGGASQEVMIPFNEIMEIQVRHKDA